MKELKLKQLLVIVLSLLTMVCPAVLADDTEPRQSTTGPVPPKAAMEILGIPAVAPVVIPGVPDYSWRHGCGPTAVGMVVGYYDGLGYDDLIPGNASTQTAAVNQAIASQGSAANRRHYEDYALPIDDPIDGNPPDTGPLPDAHITGGWIQHSNDSIADYQRTSQSNHPSGHNYYGWGYDTDVGPSFVGYVNQQNSSYSPSFKRYLWSALTWNILTNEIDNGRPMVFLVDSDGDGHTDHFVTVVAYDTPTYQYGCHDTWAPTGVRYEPFQGIGNVFGIYSGTSFQLAPTGQKWRQSPDETENGIDIRCDRSDQIPRVLADDFECKQSGPITKIIFWGSWKHDDKGLITNIHLSIHDDIPVHDPDNPYDYSVPGDERWSKDFTAAEFTETLYSTGEPEWCWDPAGGLPPIQWCDNTIWMYEISIDPHQAFTQTEGTIYWLDIHVSLDPFVYSEFGWKTSPDHWNDDAVWSGDDGITWNELRYPPGHPDYWDSIDLAFEIITPAEGKPLAKRLKWSQPPIEIDPNSDIPLYCGWDEPSLREWIEPIWFDCWDCQTQCYGDADCNGFVDEWDNTIFQAAFFSTYPNPPYNPCADFNRDLSVDTTDFMILRSNINTYPPADCGHRPQNWNIVADDFRCLGTMPVTSVHWWGSYLGWDQPEPPWQLPNAWRLGFWSNTPAPVWNPGEPVIDPENIGPVGGGWGVLEVVDNGNMDSVGAAVKSLESNTGTRYTYPLFGPINIHDSSPQTNAKNFPGDGPYGVAAAAIKPAGAVDDIAFLARGRIDIPTAGAWTFYINSDDGEELSIDYGALVIGSEYWNDNNFGTINLTAGEHDIQVIHREHTGGADVEVAAARGKTNNLYFFRLIGSGDPGLPATSSIVPGFVFDPTLTQSNPGESGQLNNLAQAQVAITMSIGMATAAKITDDRVNHSDPNNPGLGNEVFAGDHDNPWDVINGANADEDDSAILVEGELWIMTPGTYYIGYNTDDGASLTFIGVPFPWTSIIEDVTGSAMITSTYVANDTLQTDVKAGKTWTVGEIFLPAGGWPFELLMFERGGGFFLEMFGGTIPGIYDLLLTGPERLIPVPEVAPALDLVRGDPPVGGYRYSHPDKLLWQFEVPADRVEQEFAGYDEFPDMPFEACFQYYVDLEPEEWFHQNPFIDMHIPGPVAYYKFNGDPNDSSGNGHDGNEYGGPTYVPGVISQAINLDGLDDYVLTGGGTSMNGWDALTVALWVKSDVTGTDRGFIHFEDPCVHDNRGMRYDAFGASGGGTNLIKVGVTSNASSGPAGWPGRQQLESSSNVQTTDWQHLAMTWSSGKQLKLYINGVLDTPTSNEPALTGVLTGYTKVIIGRGGKYAPPAGGWDGSVDDVRIYDKALSKEQIKLQMIGLVAHYKLDESNGLIAADSSCNGNHGTLSDGPTWQPTTGGFHGGALLFDGTDDYVDCGGVGITGNAARTIGVWAKASTTAFADWTTIFGFSQAGSGNRTYFDIERDNLGNYVLHLYGWEPVLCPVDLNWHHFAATHDGFTTSWYLDGVLAGSAPNTLSTVDEVRMGVRKSENAYFPGLIDDAAIFNSALNVSQVNQLMNMGGASFIGDPNLVALWELDETSGYTAGDGSGNGNNGKLNDPPVFKPYAGYIDGALDFDGVDDYVDNGKTASQLGISGNNPRTVTTWVYTRSFIGGGIYEVGQDGPGSDGRDFSLRTMWNDNQWRMQYWGNAFDADFNYASKNKWVHFTHVHDGVTTKIYADGQEIVNVPRTLNTTNNKTFRLGRWQNNYFDGLIDDVRVYKRALDEDEIKLLTGSGDDIYWLSVAAVYPNDIDDYIQNPWGWKTRPWSWMDDAVRFERFDEPNIGMVLDPNLIYPLEDPRTRESFDVAFELDTEPNRIKWEQPFTGIRNWPHYWDEFSMATVDDQGEMWIERLVADDWPCERKKPVTAVVWWGSYIGYEYWACQDDQLPAPVKPDYFWLSIWTDVPASNDPDQIYPFSHPNEIIWEYSAYDYDEVLVGYDKYPHGIRTEPVFRYSVRLPEHDWFRQRYVNDIYWFSVVAVYKNQPQYVWGWTNHKHVYNDDAVAGNLDPAVGMWTWEELFDQTEKSEDMSFILFTDPNPVLGTCWDRFECRGQPSGDATCDGMVNLGDLLALKAAWGKSAPWTPPFCCADFNQSGAVNLGDLLILKAGWGSGPHIPSTNSQSCP